MRIDPACQILTATTSIRLCKIFFKTQIAVDSENHFYVIHESGHVQEDFPAIFVP